MGTGVGYSVLQVVNSMEGAANKKIEIKLTNRRTGDVAEVVADVSKATDQLKWVATRGIKEMCRDTWKWQSQNPNGYRK